jgi:hypothetical protein
VSNQIDPPMPFINVVSWDNNVCTVGRTNFRVCLDPDGMDAIFSVDPDARVMPRFLDGVTLVIRKLYDVWSPDHDPAHSLHDQPAWFRKFYGYCADHLEVMPSVVYGYMLHGFPYEVECRVDSPLVGWFLVLGVNRE